MLSIDDSSCLAFCRSQLLAVHAHPDDETITMGGTLARYSAAGVRTIVVTCTHGRPGRGARSGRWSVRTSPRCAPRSSQAACRVLGVAQVVQLGYGDSGMAGHARERSAECLLHAPLGGRRRATGGGPRRGATEVMVAYDETGGYGHPDHVRAHEVAVAAYRAAPTRFGPRVCTSFASR